MIDVQGYTKLYGTFAAVEDLSFTAPPGEILGLCGPNGAGKTTTLRALAGIIQPTRGVVRIAGHDIVREPLQAKARLAWVPDEPALFEHLTVLEHLLFVGRIYRVADAPVRARDLLDRLELGPKREELPHALLRGMKQKLALACALIHDPAALLLDEPLTGLDPVAIRQVKDTIAHRAKTGTAVILSSHLLSLVEELCHRVLIVKKGRKVFHGTKAEIRALHPEIATLEDAFLRLTADGA